MAKLIEPQAGLLHHWLLVSSVAFNNKPVMKHANNKAASTNDKMVTISAARGELRLTLRNTNTKMAKET